MGLFNKGAIAEKLKSMKNSTVEATQKFTSEVRKNNEASREAKAPVEGALIRYGVSYIGGLPGLPKARTGEIGLNIMPESFYLKATLTADFFEDMVITYDSVQNFEIVKRTVTMAEGLMSNNSQALATDNNIEITYLDSEQNEIVLRLEMLTGVTVNGQAVKCKEMVDLLRQHKILPRLTGKTNTNNNNNPEDIPAQIKRLNDLMESGILTEEEFQRKKTELLAKM